LGVVGDPCVKTERTTRRPEEARCRVRVIEVAPAAPPLGLGLVTVPNEAVAQSHHVILRVDGCPRLRIRRPVVRIEINVLGLVGSVGGHLSSF
jgi:hypothetical protein